MEFDEWEPAYDAIRQDFGYDRRADTRARDVLADLTQPFDRSRLTGFRDATVAVVGPTPEFPDAIDTLDAVDCVIAASSAAHVLADTPVQVDLMVTDLDKTPATARTLTESGTPVAVHGHGDNIPLLEAQVPTFDTRHVLATTQVEPEGPVRNFGGFTDGDRGAFIADACDASTLRFVGWDFDDPDVRPEKRRKLAWAARLLHWLERRRDERFPLLDGRRDGLDLPWLD